MFLNTNPAIGIRYRRGWPFLLFGSIQVLQHVRHLHVFWPGITVVIDNRPRLASQLLLKVGEGQLHIRVRQKLALRGEAHIFQWDLLERRSIAHLWS